MSELSPFLTQAIIVPVTGPRQFTQRHAVFGNSAILTTVFPQFARAQSPAKVLHILSPGDDFMSRETAELLAQLKQKCHQFGIKDDEFTLSLQGQKIELSRNLAPHQQFVLSLQQDKGFIDKFSWLQPNYLALANSQEWLNFADSYELSRAQARRRFAHLQQNDHGLRCYLSKQTKHIDFVLESPINLFKVALA
ncbi:hypothetical protein [Paraglaciecola sp.]|uniref:hypothetical protein n=1 Tax=Paraglaciecola sp. TaxID=1920173 RepID=UPI0030F407D1